MARYRVTNWGWLLAATLLAVGANRTAQAQSSPSAQFNEATTALSARLGNISAWEPAVGMDDAQVRLQLEAIDHAMEQFGTDAFPVDGLRSWDRVCERIYGVMSRYAFDGSSSDEKGWRVNAANTMRFQNEIALLADRYLQCAAVHQPALAVIVTSRRQNGISERRLRRLIDARKVYSVAILGMVRLARHPLYQRTNRERMLNSAVLWTPTLSQAMPLAQRQAMATALRSLHPPVGDAAQAGWLEILAALDNLQCSGLCLIN